MGLFNNIFGSKPERENLTVSQKRTVSERQGRRCARCNKREGPDCKLQYHHVRSVATGGETSSRNLKALCPNCHDYITRKQTEKRAIRNREEKDVYNVFNLAYKPRDTNVRVRKVANSSSIRKRTVKKKKDNASDIYGFFNGSGQSGKHSQNDYNPFGMFGSSSSTKKRKKKDDNPFGIKW